MVLTASLAACSSDRPAALNGAGATFPYPLYSAWAYNYAEKTGIRLNYQSIGSGGGVKQVSERTVDFGASDDALAPQVLSKANLLQWPQVIGGIVIVVNATGVKQQDLILDASTICQVFLGTIKTLAHPAIAALNPGLKLARAPLTVVHRSDGSGTTAVFTHYLSQTCPAWAKNVGEGKAVRWPVGIGGKGNEGVTNYVKQQSNSIGYVEFAYARQNKLPYAKQKNAAGMVVAPSLEAFAEAAAGGDYDSKRHFYTWSTNSKRPNAWPIVAATNILIARDRMAANKRVVTFFDWTFSRQGDDQAKRLDYAPLPPGLKSRVRDYWREHGLQ